MIARCSGWLAVGGCFVGYPVVGDSGEDDDPAELEDPRCDAGSIEPDDGGSETETSQIGVALPTVRTFCGRIARASTDGQQYTGDLDVALVHVLEPGRLSLVLSWEEGRTDLDVLLNTDPEAGTWTAGPDGVIDERVAEGFYTVLIAGSSGPATDYQLDVRVD